jgi:hypothetical protein
MSCVNFVALHQVLVCIDMLAFRLDVLVLVVLFSSF